MIQWLSASITEAVSSIPGQGTKILHAKQWGQKIKKKNKKNKKNHDTVDNFGKDKVKRQPPVPQLAKALTCSASLR